MSVTPACACPLAARSIRILFALGLLTLAACGGNEEQVQAPVTPAPPPPADSQPSEDPTDQPAIDLAALQAGIDGVAAELGSSETQPSETAEPAVPVVRERPAEVIAWLPEDFVTARAEKDKRLTEAVNDLIARFAPGVEEAAEEPAAPPDQVTETVASDSTPSTDGADSTEASDETAAPQPAQPGIRSRDQAIEVLIGVLSVEPATETAKTVPSAFLELAPPIIRYLVSHETEAAQKCVREIVSGQRRTLLADKGATEHVLVALAADMTGPREQLAGEILIEPTRFRSEARYGDVSPDALQKRAWEIFNPVLPRSIRTQLGKHLAQLTTPDAQRQLFLPFLRGEDPQNVPAQMALYQSSTVGDDVKQQFMGFFSRSNQAALLHVLGTAPAQDPELAYSILSEMWRDDWLAAVSLQLGLVHDLAESRKLGDLIVALPVTPVRRALHALVQRQWQAGPQQWDPNTKVAQLIQDPGLLLVVKSAPRLEDPQLKKQRLDRGRSKRPLKPMKPTDDPLELVKYQWMVASEECVMEWNARLLAAAKSHSPNTAKNRAVSPFQLAAWRNAETEEATDSEEDSSSNEKPAADAEGDLHGLPFPLHPGAVVAAEYHLDWPADLSQQLPNVKISPLVVHYVRVECDEKLTKLAGYYQRQVKAAKPRALENGRWFDLLQTDESTGRMRSLDIMVTATGPAAKPADAEEADKKEEKSTAIGQEALVIDILSIEIERLD
jgi:hypothetical protein